MKLAKRKRDDQHSLAPFIRRSLDPIEHLNRLRTELNRIMGEPFDVFAPSSSFFEGWEPSIDIFEDKDKVTVRAELPGMKKEDIAVSLEGNTLTISGERKQEEECKKGEMFRSERFFGRFQRNITLPQAVNEKAIQATYKDGVLAIECPKSEESKAKQIEVKTT